MAYLFASVTSLLRFLPTSNVVWKGSNEVELSQIHHDMKVPVSNTAVEDLTTKINQLKVNSTRKARILARLNFIGFLISVCMILYSGIYDYPIISVVSAIFVMILSFLQWGSLAESFGKSALRLEVLEQRLQKDPKYLAECLHEVEDLEVELESIRITTYFWS